MTELATQTMQTAAREIGVALGDARSALETHVEQPDNQALLQRCCFELHQVQGALRVLEIYGAALLAEEMEQVARYLLAAPSERKNRSESLDALMRAMRSEEHTSELQSLRHLVCRLLLEKKKKH